MTYKELPWWQPAMGGREYELVKAVLDSNYVNEGDVTAEFERRLANLLGVKHVVATTSGTAAIYLGLAGVGIGPGDEVIVPDVTFIATANAVAMTGAKPVLVDADSETLNIDPEAAASAVTSRTRAIVPVHVSGRPAAMTDILNVAMSYGLAVIEDAAEGFMSRLDGRCLGTFGNAGCFSFSPNKTITTGQGGAVVTDDDALHLRLRELKDQGRAARGTGGDDLHPTFGFNFKLTNLQAAVGIAQLDLLEARLERQRQIYRGYREGLAEVREVSLPGFRLEQGETPQWTDALIERRDELDRYLAARSASGRRFWLPIHTQAPYRLPDTGFPCSTRQMPKAYWLPSAFILTDDDVAAVCDYIRAFFQHGSSRSGR